jgi:hypothetical protein
LGARNVLQRAVADGVAVGVIDHLEGVAVEIEEHASLVESTGGIQLRGGVLHEAAAVEQAGEFVGA